MSAYDLLDKLRPTGVAAPLTVYRALDKLIASGRVHRIESLNAFVACRSGDHHHHRAEDDDSHPTRPAAGFAICDRCGTVEEFVEGDLFARLEQTMAKRRFTPHAIAIEVHGLCGSCRADPSDQVPLPETQG